MTNTSPGWIPNPLDDREELYWNGTAWTGEKRPRPDGSPSDLGPSLAAPEEASPTGRRGLPRWAMIAIPVAAALIVALIAVLVFVAVPAANLARDKTLVVAACKAGIRDQLKSPSTAKFGPIKPVSLLDASNAALKKEGKKPQGHPAKDGSVAYIMSGYVDAENGFGAHIRNHLTCIESVRDGHVKSSGGEILIPQD
jgi:hypothetical protein